MTPAEIVMKKWEGISDALLKENITVSDLVTVKNLAKEIENIGFSELMGDSEFAVWKVCHKATVLFEHLQYTDRNRNLEAIHTLMRGMIVLGKNAA